jgi:hypothetical protein
LGELTVSFGLFYGLAVFGCYRFLVDCSLDALGTFDGDLGWASEVVRPPYVFCLKMLGCFDTGGLLA